jgi:peptide/nickel transport system permease protein
MMVRPALLALILLWALVPELYCHNPYVADAGRILSPPTASHWFGTDRQGRDLFARSMYGGRRSLLLACAAEALVLLIGLAVGAASGYLHNPVLSFLTESIGAVALALPFLLLALVTAAIFSSRDLPLILAVALVGWVYSMRIIRREVARLRGGLPVVAALSWGFSSRGIVLKIILPRLFYIVPSLALFGMAEIITIEAGLSFFGIGVIGAPPSLGGMLLEARTLAVSFWWLAAGPSLVLMSLILTCNFLAQSWRPHAEARP